MFKRLVALSAVTSGTHAWAKIRWKRVASPDAYSHGKMLLVEKSVRKSLTFVESKTAKVTKMLENIEDSYRLGASPNGK
ncbi:hypothetical protein KEX41_29380 (plasmid) [Burkholderia thailandensis]|uniref:hypothetical protein n=1 Tax=Burkholderia thailandensis TaxID=57975 RepID=UPI00192D99EA|nr:hypothetical protein [Burkholderia thailandensis]MBS2132296.1 hypothetical protein [Burkholderia thailandensis]QRA15107.1 hypothetical protein JMY07_29805 [Burkholderia thailandensis]